MPVAFLQLGLKLPFLVLDFSQSSNKDKVVGLVFPVVDHFKVCFVLLVDVFFGCVHVGIS